MFDVVYVDHIDTEKWICEVYVDHLTILVQEFMSVSCKKQEKYRKWST